MLNTLLKRKLTDDQLANLFVNMLIDSVDASYEEIVNLIKDDVAFVTPPKPETLGMDHLILIVFGANMTLAQNVLDVEPAAELNKLVVRKLSGIFDMNETEFAPLLKDYQAFVNHVNFPSKNLVYGMSKAIFAKYELAQYQDQYFREMNAPNPMFLQRFNEITDLFLWDWDAFFKKYRL
jgi:CO dehydrogenase/acetyl-CoA synthase delta subunit